MIIIMKFKTIHWFWLFSNSCFRFTSQSSNMYSLFRCNGNKLNLSHMVILCMPWIISCRVDKSVQLLRSDLESNLC